MRRYRVPCPRCGRALLDVDDDNRDPVGYLGTQAVRRLDRLGDTLNVTCLCHPRPTLTVRLGTLARVFGEREWWRNRRVPLVPISGME